MSRDMKRGRLLGNRQLQRCAEFGTPRTVISRAFHGLMSDSARRRLLNGATLNDDNEMRRSQLKEVSMGLRVKSTRVALFAVALVVSHYLFADSLSEALDVEGVNFTTGGSGWDVVTDDKHFGPTALRSKGSGYGSAWIECEVDGPAVVGFFYRDVKDEDGEMQVRIDDDLAVVTKSPGSKKDWRWGSVRIPEGMHSVRWTAIDLWGLDSVEIGHGVSIWKGYECGGLVSETNGYHWCFNKRNGEAVITGADYGDEDEVDWRPGIDRTAAGLVVVPSVLDGAPLTGIGTHMFYNLECITDMVIPSSVRNIDADAFEGCSGLKRVYTDKENISTLRSLIIGSGFDCSGLSFQSSGFELSDVQIRQDEKINGMIDCDFAVPSLAPVCCGFVLARNALGTELPMASVELDGVPVCATNFLMYPGRHRLTWNIGKDVGDGLNESVDLRLHVWNKYDPNMSGTITWSVPVNTYELWTVAGDGKWFVATNDTYECFQCGGVSDNQSAELSYAFTGCERDVVSFYWKSDTERGYDIVYLLVDGVVCDQLSGSSGWRYSSVEIPQYGWHTITWKYEKDEDEKNGSDTVWVRDVKIANSRTIDFTKLTSTYQRIGNSLTDVMLTKIKEPSGTAVNGDVLEIPTTIDGYNVVALGGGCLDDSLLLRRIVIPEGVTTIADGVFASDNPNSLQSISFPSTIKHFGKNRWTYALERVEVADPVKWATINFPNPDSPPTTFCRTMYSRGRPVSKLELWGSVGDYVFFNCTNILEVTTRDSVSTIGDFAFAYCTNLERVRFSERLQSVSNYAFEGCKALQTAFFEGMSTTCNENLVFSKCPNVSVSKVFVSLPDTATSQDVNDALTRVNDKRVLSNVTNIVTYKQFVRWADRVSSGSTNRATVRSSEVSWPSFALDATSLMDKELTSDDLTIADVATAADGSLSVVVRLKDVTVGDLSMSENIMTVLGVEGTSSLASQPFSADNARISALVPQGGGVKCVVFPVGNSASFFMRVKVK